MRAVVVGAGLAGLVAADELVRGGVEVVVLEARVAGRRARVVARLPNGAVVEMGAEFILPGNTAVRELADRFGLGLWDKGMRYGRRDPRGGIGTTHEELAAAVAQVERALAGLRRAAPARAAARDFLDSLDIPAGAREAILARVEISSANSADRVAAADLAGVAHIDDEPAPSIAGGNQRLPLALAAELGAAVDLDAPVDAIEWGEAACASYDRRRRDRGRRRVDRRSRQRARPHRLRPARCPRPSRGALGRVEYGHAAKLFVPLRRPAAPSAVMSVPGALLDLDRHRRRRTRRSRS